MPDPLRKEALPQASVVLSEEAPPPKEVLPPLSKDVLEAWEFSWCRAFRRPSLMSEPQFFCGHSRLIEELMRLRPRLDPMELHKEFLHDSKIENLAVKESSFRQFLNRQVSPDSEKGREEWYRRAAICTRLLLEGNKPDEKSEATVIARRIWNFFFRWPTMREALNDHDYYFSPAYAKAEMPMNTAEVAAELQAMCYFRGIDLAADCRIVRVSGWQAFPIEHRLGRITAQALACNVPTHFIVADLQPVISQAELSLETVRLLVGEHVRLLIGEHVKKSEVDAALQNMHCHKLSAGTVTAAGGRRMDYLANSFFRWAYYCCPKWKGDVHPVHSLVAVRAIADPGTAFSFCPTHQEAKDFLAWFKGLKLVPPPAETQ